MISILAILVALGLPGLRPIALVAAGAAFFMFASQPPMDAPPEAMPETMPETIPAPEVVPLPQSAPAPAIADAPSIGV